MLNREKVLTDRRFWAVVYAEMLGQISEPVDPLVIYSLLAVTENDAQDWFDDTMKWHTADEEHDTTPRALRVPLARGMELAIEFEFGDVIWILRDPDGDGARVANIGGHWELPGLRWEEAIRIASASPDPNWMILLLLLPIVWLTEETDVPAVKSTVESAWLASSCVTEASASDLADAWLKAVEGGRAYRWRRLADGWVCDAEWSTRGEQRDVADVELINRLIEVAAGEVT